MGFAGLLSGVSGAFSQHAAALLRRARDLRGPQFAAALFPWAAIRSWVLRATVVQETCTRSIHAGPGALRVFPGTAGPTRVSKFGGDIPAVAGPSAFSGDLRLADPTDSKQSLRYSRTCLRFGPTSCLKFRTVRFDLLFPARCTADSNLFIAKHTARSRSGQPKM